MTDEIAVLEAALERVKILEKQMALLMSTKSVDISDEKPKKQKKIKVDNNSDNEDKPKKKRTSGYILYSNANRDEVKEALMEGDEKPKNTDIMKKLAAQWKELPDDEREQWNNKAKEIKEAQ